MTNPFDDEDGDYLILRNDEGQYSLWPSFRETPEGWIPVGPRGSRAICLEWVDQNWTDLRPRSLIERIARGLADDAL